MFQVAFFKSDTEYGLHYAEISGTALIIVHVYGAFFYLSETLLSTLNDLPHFIIFLYYS